MTATIARGPIDWKALMGARYWHPTMKVWCAYNDYDVECPKCAEGMLVFQAEYDCLFGLAAQDCACDFTDTELETLCEDIDQRFAERCRSEP